MNRISLVRLRLALRNRLAVKASPLGGWLVGKPLLGFAPPNPRRTLSLGG